MKAFFDVDHATGAVETFHFDESTGDWAIERVADVQPIIDRNKELANHGVHRKTPGDLDMRLVAEIPCEVIYLWLVRYGINALKREHWPAVKRLLNSNEWRGLRTDNSYL